MKIEHTVNQYVNFSYETWRDSLKNFSFSRHIYMYVYIVYSINNSIIALLT